MLWRQWPVRGLMLLVRGYQLSFAFFLGGRCRFHPHCSNYALAALQQHGALKGSILTLWRIGRCGPGGGHGFDPVPKVWHEALPRVKRCRNCARHHR